MIKVMIVNATGRYTFYSHPSYQTKNVPNVFSHTKLIMNTYTGMSYFLSSALVAQTITIRNLSFRYKEV